jgi:hypothetical protein
MMVLGDMGDSGSGGIGSSVSDTQGLIWNLIGRSTASSVADEAVGWWTVSNGTATTITTKGLSFNSGGKGMQVFVISGADIVTPIGNTNIGTNGATTGGISKTVAATRKGSWAFLAISDWDAQADPTVTSGTLFSKNTFNFGLVNVTAGYIYNSTDTAVGSNFTITTSGPSGSKNSWMMFELLPAKPDAIIVGMKQAIQRPVTW